MAKNTEKTTSVENEKFYSKFTQPKKSTKKAKNNKKEYKPSENRNHKISNSKTDLNTQKDKFVLNPYKILNSQFELKAVPEDAKAILENFDQIVQNTRPLNSKQIARLPDDIRELSHHLTDQRSERRLGYMNENIQLSAYVRYFTWWNFVRLTRLFSNLSSNSFPSKDCICLDLGSGPLTVVSALWLARPELRKLKLTWYCLDVSSNSMALGEDLYLSIVSRTAKEGEEPWKIIRVKGSFGTIIKQKCQFITCANMFNELDQASDMPPEFQTKKYFEQLMNYAEKEAKFILIEPGVPKAARTLTLLRERFIKTGFDLNSPCPHSGECPMSGFKAYTGSQNKWCNFAFSTETAPSKLLKLSERAKLPKERATLMFISATKKSESAPENKSEISQEKELLCRVISDSFSLPQGRTGFYACSRLGLTLLSVKVSVQNETPQLPFVSGDLLSVKLKTPETDLLKDQKSGAVVVLV